MAQPQTLTYDSTPADQPEFNEAEQEALQIGEQAEADQQQMLAGKFKDAEALEQAYIELQKKLGSNEETSSEEGAEESSPEPEEQPESFTLINNASNEWNEKGELSAETLSQLESMDSKELIAAYMEMQSKPQQAPDLTQQDVDTIYQAVGGAESYNALTTWASDSLPEAAVTAYNNIVNSGDPGAIQLALAGLRAAYDEANGVDGQMLTGKAAVNKQDVFRSQAEVVKAMSDARYDKDPAYRQDVFAKLERSNIDY